MNDFTLHVKSTIDKLGKDLADSMSVEFVDLDDTVNVQSILTSDNTALIWRFVGMEESPRDPLYTLTFAMGIKITSDPSNYNLLDMVSAVKELFKHGDWLDVYDYSTTSAPVAAVGAMIFVESGVDPQVMDRESGARMLTVVAKCVRG